MKKGLLILAFATLAASAFISCKVVEPCPAYGSVEMVTPDAEQA